MYVKLKVMKRFMTNWKKNKINISSVLKKEKSFGYLECNGVIP